MGGIVHEHVTFALVCCVQVFAERLLMKDVEIGAATISLEQVRASTRGIELRAWGGLQHRSRRSQHLSCDMPDCCAASALCSCHAVSCCGMLRPVMFR